MHDLKQVESEQTAAPKKVVSRRDALVNDLDLMISVAIARIMVWRTLRRSSQERVARLKHLKLIHRGNDDVEKVVIASSHKGGTKCST